MDSTRGQFFYEWCHQLFAGARVHEMPEHVDASAMDVQSFLRWQGQTAESPAALLMHMHHVINTGIPEAGACTIHLGVMNAALEVAQTETSMGPVQSELYLREWRLREAATIGTYFIDESARLAHWPFPETELRMVHFDWTVFAWQWRLLVNRSVSDLFPRYVIYNGLDDRVMSLARHYRSTYMPTKEREIRLAIDADGQPSGTDQGIQRKWRGILSALHTLFLHRGPAPVTYFLHTCAPDGLWLAVVCTLIAHEQGVPLSRFVCQWRDQPPIDAALIAFGMIKHFKKAASALAACLLFWVDTQCTDTDAYSNLFERLKQGTIRPSKGADFLLSLTCLTYGRVDHTFENTAAIQSTCGALCRAAWQRTHVTSQAERRPAHIVYPRIFWEAWGAACPDFDPAIVQCITWLNFCTRCLVDDKLDTHVLAPDTTGDTLFYGLASRVDGTRPRVYRQ